MNAEREAGGGLRTAADRLGVARLLACVLARELRDGEIVAFGLHAELLLAAALLAQRLHAPNLVIRHGLRVERGADLQPAAWTADSTSRSHEVIEYLESHDAILDVANPASPLRFCDVFLVGGMQIDREGSTNLIGIKGEDGRMKVRGPGSIGTTSIGTLARHVILFSGEHTARRFVERVDYVSVPGWRRRAAAGLEGGPSLCVTPLAVFAFEDGSMRLRSVHPHASEQDVRRRTGFPLPAGAAPKTPAPSAAEQAALDIVDPFDRLAAVDLRPDGGEP
ncbi:MAG TPA: CoA-transferase [Candidatus Polarisedimenticolia bacterium]|nr:CoA-transferase [Candidatus Polarisedimenticolia bacterium]